MKFITLVTALAVALPAVVGLSINTPSSVVACEPTQLQWNGGSSPYYVSAVPAGQPSATPFEQFPAQNGTSYTWNVDLAPGVSFTLVIKDGTGEVAYSDIVTVGSGSSTSCVNASISASGGSTATSGAASTADGSAAGGSTATSASPSGTATTSAGSTSSTHSSGAGRLSVSSAFGVAGAMGLLGAMLF